MASRKYKRRKNGQFASKGESGGSSAGRSASKGKLTKAQKRRRNEKRANNARMAVGAVGVVAAGGLLARRRGAGKAIGAIASATKKAVGGTRAISAGTKLKKARRSRRTKAYKITSM